jgi:hypothetical protein
VKFCEKNGKKILRKGKILYSHMNSSEDLREEWEETLGEGGRAKFSILL